MWAILGAQGQTRTGILGEETAFDAQKQFLANFEDAISAPVDIPAAINRYQESLQYARSEVNYSFGKGLYMAPSDMLLLIGKIAGYNNLIIIAIDAQSLGLNSDLKKDIIPPDAANHTGERGSLYRWAPTHRQRRPPTIPPLQQQPQPKQTMRTTRTKKQPSS